MGLDKVRTMSAMGGRVPMCFPGQITLTKLRLKKGALDKFRLPVDVIDGEFNSLSMRSYVSGSSRPSREAILVAALAELGEPTRGGLD